jgi:hypothetical protein
MTEDETERVYLDAPSLGRDSWWGRYSAELTALTPTARYALQADCAYILDKGILGGGEPGDWVGRVRTGLVMGSVQSGKTASMFGVTAMALDHNVDVVIVLAGTRLSLWRQTYERLTEQLDVGEENAAKVNRRLLCPRSNSELSGATSSLRDIYRISSAQVRRKLNARRPLIIVAMKQTDHLYALGSAMRSAVFPALRELGRPAHLLVLDDEADDGSVLDAVVEAGRDSLWSGFKQIPRAIADLWDPRSENSPSNLFTTYVGYTATPQANLLQEDHNPLAPRDFVISLRTPLDVGYPVDVTNVDALRSSTYPEPNGLDSFYTGGEIYYKRGDSANLCIELTQQGDEDLGEAIRAFLVAGAIRLHSATGKLGPRSISHKVFDSEAAAAAASPKPHSMLLHPAAGIEDHFKAAEDVLMWAGISDRSGARRLLESGVVRLPGDLVARMQVEQPLWEAWIDRYRRSSAELTTEFNVIAPRAIPDWPSIKELLETEIIPGTRVSVVNSDPSADDRPEYKPSYDESTGKWRPARDLSTIFVSGNVMARGLTLEGMTTALFQRGATVPLADTQMQMQRWFGYRGPYIELCRLFASRHQIDLFRSYHDIDEAIRIAISDSMQDGAPAPAILHGLQFLATGKIANLGRAPLCSSSRPFITLINRGETPDPNADLVANLFASEKSSDVIVGQRVRGRGLDRELSLIEAADLLQGLSYESYFPGNESRFAQLWSQVEARVSAVHPLPTGNRLYRAPDPTAGAIASQVRPDCPYAISAYLRLWDACLTRAVRGLFVTGAPSDLWSMADLQEKRLHKPLFSVGIRYGAGPTINTGSLSKLGFDIPATTKGGGKLGELETRWGTNDPAAGPLDYRGDEFFDFYHRGERIPLLSAGNPWRPAGSHGQILFYINQLPGQPHPAIALGVCIPAGGPEQFAAIRSPAPSAA